MMQNWNYITTARYYSPDLGRFISRDPIDVRDDVNLYAYVGNNGVMFVDRSGLSKDWYKEIVFDYATWVKVVSDEDMWSYNYFNPNINPLEHFIYDTIPYFLYWNSYNDETTKADRILKTFNLVPAGINDWKDNIDSKIQIT